jgi:hypothetical protein
LKLKGVLDTPSFVTIIGVVPGTFAVIVAVPGSKPLTGLPGFDAAMVATLALMACQVKGPTVAVISKPGAG